MSAYTWTRMETVAVVLIQQETFATKPCACTSATSVTWPLLVAALVSPAVM